MKRCVSDVLDRIFLKQRKRIGTQKTMVKPVMLMKTSLLYINLWFSIMNFLFSLFFKNWMNVSQTRKINIFEPQISLNDAILCMGLQNASRYISSYEERLQHCKELHEKISQFVPSHLPYDYYAGYRGPKVENAWMDLQRLNLSEFGYFIPIFVSWRCLTAFDYHGFKGRVQKIYSLLSDRFLYVTVNEHEEGIQSNLTTPSNLFLINEGGTGHIPFPMILKELQPKEVLEQKYIVSFLGKYDNHPIRSRLKEIVPKIVKGPTFLKKT
jgi:hypothetical protein